jgi:single-strand DNA-binding protein
MNNITLVGRAGRDPEVRYFESGTNVCNLTIAVNRRKKDEDPDWFNLEIWGKTAEVAANYVRKGGLIGVTGSMHQEKWTDRATGEEKTKWVVRVDKLDLLGSKRDNDGGAAPAPAAVAPARPAAPMPATSLAAGQASPAGWGNPVASNQPAWNTAPISDEEVPF